MKHMSFVMDIMRRNTILLQIYFVSCFVPFAHSITSVIKHEHATWYQASDSCGNDGLEFEERIFNEVGTLHGKMFWLGKAIYSKTSEWIEILGCFNITVTNATTTRTFTEVSCVAECQIKCWSISFTTFGYKMTTHRCVCTKDKPLTKTRMQACRSKTYTNSYFFYQVYLGQIENGVGGHCTSLSCSGGYNNLKGVDCTEIGPAALCGSRKFGRHLWAKTFANSLEWCMSKNQLLLAPLNYCKIDGNFDEAVTSWSNVFSDVWNRQLTQEEGGYVRPIQCLAGQMVQVDGQLKLHKTKKECNEVLDLFVCRSETHNKHTDLTRMVSFSLSTKTNTIGGYIKTENILNTMYIYTSVSPRVSGSSELTNAQRDHNKKGNSSKIIGAVIGGVLGACSMIAVVSVLIVCKLRSKGIFTKSNNHVYEDTGQVIRSKTVYEDVSNTRIKNTTTAATQTCDLSQFSSPVYDNIKESK